MQIPDAAPQPVLVKHSLVEESSGSCADNPTASCEDPCLAAPLSWLPPTQLQDMKTQKSMVEHGLPYSSPGHNLAKGTSFWRRRPTKQITEVHSNEDTEEQKRVQHKELRDSSEFKHSADATASSSQKMD